MFKYVGEEMNLIESTLGTRRYQKDQKVKTIGTRETNRIREQKKTWRKPQNPQIKWLSV